MAPKTHTSGRAEFHYAYCSQPCKGLGDHMVRACPVVLAAALFGFRAACARVQARGCAVRWHNTLSATVYDRAGRTSHWRLARDEDVVVRQCRVGRGDHLVRANVGQGPTLLASP